MTTEEILGYIQLAKETKEHSDEPLEASWIESSDEWVVHRGSTIIAEGLKENPALRLLDFLQGECDE